MRQFILSIILGIAMCSATALYAEQNNFPLQILDGTGIETANALNTAYNNTAKKCAADAAAWHCSGVMLRAVPEQSDYFVRYRSASEINNNALSFSYLRKDVNTEYLSNGVSGMIVNNQVLGSKSSIFPNCIFPFTSSIEAGARRNNNGCGLIDSAGRPSTHEKASCALQMSAADWLKEYAAKPLKGCSFSINSNADFMSALKTHNDIEKNTIEHAGPMQMLTSHEYPNTQEGLPLQALYYDVTVTNGNAEQSLAPSYLHKYQREFYRNKNKFLPIIRVNLNRKGNNVPPGHNIFSYNPLDQSGEVRGKITAAALNARYAARADTCDQNQPAYKCNGIVLRATDSSVNRYFWDVSQKNRVAFSYFRSDLKTNEMAFSRAQGFIVDASANTTHNQAINIRCAFPLDGDTDARENDGCGNNDRNNVYKHLPGLCKDRPVTDDALTSNGKMVTTFEAWTKNFHLVDAGNPMRYSHQCVFLPTTDDFALNLKARRSLTLAHEDRRYRQNEVVVQPWAKNSSQPIAIEAIFYAINSDGGTGSDNAKQMQLFYNRLPFASSHIVPIVFFNRLAAASGSLAPFVFIESDQSAQYPSK